MIFKGKKNSGYPLFFFVTHDSGSPFGRAPDERRVREPSESRFAYQICSLNTFPFSSGHFELGHYKTVIDAFFLQKLVMTAELLYFVVVYDRNSVGTAKG